MVQREAATDVAIYNAKRKRNVCSNLCSNTKTQRMEHFMKQTLRVCFSWHTIIFVFGSINCVRSPRAIPVHYFDSTGHATQVCEIQLFILCFFVVPHNMVHPSFFVLLHIMVHTLFLGLASKHNRYICM